MTNEHEKAKKFDDLFLENNSDFIITDELDTGDISNKSLAYMIDGVSKTTLSTDEKTDNIKNTQEKINEQIKSLETQICNKIDKLEIKFSEKNADNSNIEKGVSGMNNNFDEKIEELKSFISNNCISKDELNTVNLSNEKINIQIESLKDQNNTTRWILGILITLFGIVLPILFNMHAKSIDAQIKSIETKIDSKYELINQQLNTMKELNAMQIQRDVAKEVTNKH